MGGLIEGKVDPKYATMLLVPALVANRAARVGGNIVGMLAGILFGVAGSWTGPTNTSVVAVKATADSCAGGTAESCQQLGLVGETSILLWVIASASLVVAVALIVLGEREPKDSTVVGGPTDESRRQG